MDVFTTRGGKGVIPISPVGSRQLKAWLAKQPKMARTWLSRTGFRGDEGQVALVPGRDGTPSRVVVGLGEGGNLWCYAAIPAVVGKGRFRIDATLAPEEATAAALGWALGCYSFDRYRKEARAPQGQLVWPEGCDQAEVTRLASATMRGRDLVNTPAADLGPLQIAEEVRALGKQYGAKVKVISGAALERDFPSIHAVGKGAAEGRRPQLCELRWGPARGRRLALVGKGVVFDTGGLDIKSAAGMRYMKKDMGGAASILALARLVMDAELPVNLRVLIPTVENAVSAEAYRPGDILRTRKGLSVEVGNTDAEGRLILIDALSYAAEEDPELVIDFATLTGAARVALGSELPAVFCSHAEDAEAVRDASALHVHDPDPLWHMPLYRPYRRHLDSAVADISNVDSVGLGGAITAALFMQEFVGRETRWMHVDTNAWNVGKQPGRPDGGEMLGVRTMYRVLAARFGRDSAQA